MTSGRDVFMFDEEETSSDSIDDKTVDQLDGQISDLDPCGGNDSNIIIHSTTSLAVSHPDDIPWEQKDLEIKLSHIDETMEVGRPLGGEFLHRAPPGSMVSISLF